jgi:hypothetical protein
MTMQRLDASDAYNCDDGAYVHFEEIAAAEQRGAERGRQEEREDIARWLYLPVGGNSLFDKAARAATSRIADVILRNAHHAHGHKEGEG